eukprot:jgi/Bigna1/90693/estExt_fgenesh1_pg.C_760101
MDYTAFALTFLAVFVASGVGIGGGGILVPLFTLSLAFQPQYAIPLSNITIFGGSIANAIINIRRKHPLVERPLIDWNLILVMEPMTILGALLGSFVNKVSPGWLTSSCLALVLTVTTYRLTRKGVRMYKKENESKLAPEMEQGMKDTVEYSHLEEDQKDEGLFPPEDDIDDTLEKVVKSEQRMLPWEKVAGISSVFAVIVVLTLLKGGSGFQPLHVTCGSVEYWCMTLATIPVVMLAFIVVRSQLIKEYHKKEEIGYVYAQGDVRWNEKATVVYPGICAFAGLFAGMFGIGGGIVKGPLMLEMNVLPEVSAATSSMMIFYTSGAASVSYLVFGMLRPDYGGPLFMIGFIGTFMGQIVMNWVLEKLRRKSILIFIIAILIGASTILMTLTSVEALIAGNGSKSICGHH